MIFYHVPGAKKLRSLLHHCQSQGARPLAASEIQLQALVEGHPPIAWANGLLPPSSAEWAELKPLQHQCPTALSMIGCAHRCLVYIWFAHRCQSVVTKGAGHPQPFATLQWLLLSLQAWYPAGHISAVPFELVHQQLDSSFACWIGIWKGPEKKSWGRWRCNPHRITPGQYHLTTNIASLRNQPGFPPTVAAIRSSRIFVVEWLQLLHPRDHWWG